jgi:hypothetical protein
MPPKTRGFGPARGAQLRFEAADGAAQRALRREVLYKALVALARIAGSDREAAQEPLQLPQGSTELVPRSEAVEERRSIPRVSDRQRSHLASANDAPRGQAVRPFACSLRSGATESARRPPIPSAPIVVGKEAMSSDAPTRDR